MMMLRSRPVRHLEAAPSLLTGTAPRARNRTRTFRTTASRWAEEGERSALTGASSSKICAVPFHFTPEAAEARTRMAALLASATLPNMIAALIYRYLPTPLQSLLQPILVELGLSGHSIKLEQVRPVLWPTWRFMGVWEGKVEADLLKLGGGGFGTGTEDEDESGSAMQRGIERERVRGTGAIGISEGGFPGNSFSPLSLLSFSNQVLPPNIPIYDPSLDLAQLGTDPSTSENLVKAVPFTIPPRDVINRAVDEIMSRGKRKADGRVEWEGLEFDLRKGWKEEMLALYPIYMPIYIAEYTHSTEADNQGPVGYNSETDDDFRAQNSAGRSSAVGKMPRGKTQTLTIVMDAHMENADECRIAVPRPWSNVKADEPKSYYVSEANFLTDLGILLNPPKLTMASMFSRSKSLTTGQPTVSEAFQAMTYAVGGSSGPGLSNKLSQAFGSWLCPTARPDVWDEAQHRGGRYLAPKSPLAALDTGVELTEEQWAAENIISWDEEQRTRNADWVGASLNKVATQIQLEGVRGLGNDPNAPIKVIGLKGGGRTFSLPEMKEMSSGDLVEGAEKDHREAKRVWEETMPEWVREKRNARGERP